MIQAAKSVMSFVKTQPSVRKIIHTGGYRKPREDTLSRTTIKTGKLNRINFDVWGKKHDRIEVNGYVYFMAKKKSIEELKEYKNLEIIAKNAGCEVNVKEYRKLNGQAPFDYQKQISNYRYKKEIGKRELTIHLQGKIKVDELSETYRAFIHAETDIANRFS